MTKRLKVYDDFYLEHIFNCDIVRDYWYSGAMDFEYGPDGYYFIKQRKFQSNIYIPFVKDGIPISLEECLNE